MRFSIIMEFFLLNLIHLRHLLVLLSSAIYVVLFLQFPVYADESKGKALSLFDGRMSIMISKGDETFEVSRKKTPEALIGGVLQPIVPVKGVHPVGEVEVLKALQDESFKVVDMRTLDWRMKATIPGSYHIPYTEVASRLNELGCQKNDKGWDCAKAMKVVAFCNGANCPQSPVAIKAMVRVGFPPDRIYYYRGGMNSWIVMGLTVSEGEF